MFADQMSVKLNLKMYCASHIMEYLPESIFASTCPTLTFC